MQKKKEKQAKIWRKRKSEKRTSEFYRAARIASLAVANSKDDPIQIQA